MERSVALGEDVEPGGVVPTGIAGAALVRAGDRSRPGDRSHSAALRVGSIQKVATGRRVITTPALALRATRYALRATRDRLAGVSMDELLADPHRPVAIGPGLPALRPLAGRFYRRGDGGRIGVTVVAVMISESGSMAMCPL